MHTAYFNQHINCYHLFCFLLLAMLLTFSVFAGVVKDSAIQSFTTFLSEVVAPVLKSKKDWGQCSSEQVTTLY